MDHHIRDELTHNQQRVIPERASVIDRAEPQVQRLACGRRGTYGIAELNAHHPPRLSIPSSVSTESPDALAGDTAVPDVAAYRTELLDSADADGAPLHLGDDEGLPPEPGLFPAPVAELLGAILLEFELEVDRIAVRNRVVAGNATH
jgi:hypothetical protein